MRVLLIDDDAAFSSFFKKFIERCGDECMSVSNAIDGKNAVHEFFPDLILLDIMLPEVDGFELLRYFQAGLYVGAVVAMSSLDDPRTIELCRQLGASAFVVKGAFDQDKIQRLLSRFRVPSSPSILPESAENPLLPA